MIESAWDSAKAAAMNPVEQLVYASNLLGSDPRITNFGGGNTSAKLTATDPLTGEPVRVMWVKGSGGDLGSAKMQNFASLYLDRVLKLEDKQRAEGLPEDAIVALYNHCTFNLNPTACSIDTPLHAFVPFDAVSHMHSDAVIAIAACEDCEAITKEIWGDEMGVLPWKRPGFDLGLMLRDLIAANPKAKGAIMQSHGFICWADTWQECYELTLRMINQAQTYLNERTRQHPFGNPVVEAHPDPKAVMTDLLPKLRGRMAYNGQRLIAHVDGSPEVMDFLSRSKMPELAKLGTSCPDHFLRTKIRPLVLTATDDNSLDSALSQFREAYKAYYERCKHADSPAMRNPNPSVVLVPGVGMVSFGKNPQEAKVTGQFYKNAIAVMRGAEAVSKYVALPEQEAFNIEYWLLEEAKLKRMPPEKEYARQVAVITGGAQGIGFATAKRLAIEGACVVLLDINDEKLEAAAHDIDQVAANAGSVLTCRCDVTDGSSITEAFAKAVRKFGGVDIAVACAGNARRGSVADTDDANYDFLSDLLMKGYFMTMREAANLMITQGTGGSIVVVGSKNAIAVGQNAAIYSAAKAFELHLMRTTASDLAKYNIRCNAVNPDAVLQGSAIWQGAWREETAKSLGIAPDELEEHYRKRSMLGVVVSTDDIAEAIAWLSSEKRSSRTTGCVIPVDGGVREAFPR